jgi:hypothetical protein
MKTPEGKVKDEIKTYLNSIGAYHFWPVQTGYGAATVDCLGCFEGCFFAIEAKRPGGKPTARQLLTLQQVRSAGGLGIVADSVAVVRDAFRDR